MRTAATEMFGMELPIFAFSHCRDVVAEASKAGGMGVLGAAWMTPEELEVSLRWIDERVGDKPYAVDIVFPGSFQPMTDDRDPGHILPAGHRNFLEGVLDEAGIPKVPADELTRYANEFANKINMTPADSERSLEIALRHPVKLIVSAMGAAPLPVIERCHAAGRKVGALIGSVEHARRQRDLGVDILIAQGSEAGGHVGQVSSMVLWPQVVEAVSPLPVLAAGGISRGRQFAAAMAMGVAGIWCGSIWLATRESDLTPEMKAQLFGARSQDSIVSLALSGKPCRVLKSKYTDAWGRAGAPQPLTFPLQSILGGPAMYRAERAHRLEYWTYAVGQVVGDMHEETTVRQIFADLQSEYVEAIEALTSISYE